VARTGAGPTGESRFLFEVYTGNVAVGFENTEAPTSGEQFSIYLPLFDNTIRTYGNPSEGEGDIPPLTNAVLVTPVGIQAHEDEEFVCSVDSWKLRLEPQGFQGIGGKPLCLILDFHLSILNGVIHRVGYNVTISTPSPGHLKTIDLTDTARPH